MDQNDQKKQEAKDRMAKARAAKGKKPQIVSTEGMPDDAARRLHAENAELRRQIEALKASRSEAEQAALASAQAQGTLLMQSSVEEVPTGKTVAVRRRDDAFIDESGMAPPGYRVVGYRDDHDGRPILKPVMKTERRKTYFYKIDLPPCGGTDLKINGVAFYHGATYELDEDQLRSVKEIVYRCWKHDADIHGSDENFYRKPQKQRLSARGMLA